MKKLTKKNIAKINKTINLLKKMEISSGTYQVIEDYGFDYDTDEAEAEFFEREPMYETIHEEILECYSEELDYPQEMIHSDGWGHMFLPTTYLANVKNCEYYNFNLSEGQKLLTSYFKDGDLNEKECEDFLNDFTDYTFLFNFGFDSARERDTSLEDELEEIFNKVA